jgi:hypothetical protein
VSGPSITPPGLCGDSNHILQFYESDEFLCEVVVDFLATGLAAGESVVAIATDAHRQEIKAALRRRDADIDAAILTGQALMLDARATLADVMVGSDVDPALFQQVIGGHLTRVHRAGTRVRVFGEMGGLLWMEGNREACLRIEEAWNRLSKQHELSLLCAYYASTNVPEHLGSTCSVSALHDRVLPTQHCAKSPKLELRLRHLFMLEQHARVLQAEAAKRCDAEKRMRASLSDAEAKLARTTQAVRGHVTVLQLELQSALRAASPTDEPRMRAHLLRMVTQLPGWLPRSMPRSDRDARSFGMSQ